MAEGFELRCMTMEGCSVFFCRICKSMLSVAHLCTTCWRRAATPVSMGKRRNPRHHRWRRDVSKLRATVKTFTQ